MARVLYGAGPERRSAGRFPKSGTPVTKAHFYRLREGMTENQARVVMGEPSVVDWQDHPPRSKAKRLMWKNAEEYIRVIVQ
jgi:hypothetical protein